MPTFDTFAVGDTVFVPRVHSKDIDVTCPDCLGENQWVISTPSGISRTIDCPRCMGGKRDYAWMKPKRYERTLEIQELKITEVCITSRKAHNRDEVDTSISYQLAGGWSMQRRGLYLTRAEAEVAGAALLAEGVKEEHASYLAELKKNEERSAMDIIRAFESKAYERARALDEKIERLKEKMMDAVKYPSLNGPKVTRRSYGGDEITPHSLLEWMQELLSEADIDGWSEEEVHEATCHC
jgi:hypothetical protein